VAVPVRSARASYMTPADDTARCGIEFIPKEPGESQERIGGVLKNKGGWDQLALGLHVLLLGWTALYSFNADIISDADLTVPMLTPLSSDVLG
jgi:hypothetical protein